MVEELKILKLCLFFGFVATSFAEEPIHGLAMHGDLKYSKNAKHFEYVTPRAPKGGSVKFKSSNFDSLNPYILKGIPCAHVLGRVYATLMKRSMDEPFSVYGWIAESMEVPEDRSWVIFNLRETAVFEDGSPILADDIVFTHNLLKEKGSPNQKLFRKKVQDAIQLGERKVKFIMNAKLADRETVMTLGNTPAFSKKIYEKLTFENTTHLIPVSSGPYRISSFEPGKYAEFERKKDYWGAELLPMKGQYNFDKVRFDVYRDSNIAFESFKGGEFDVFHETDLHRWHTRYDFPAIKEGRVKQLVYTQERPMGMLAIALNGRREIFKDQRVRKALILALDFDWFNKNYYYGEYKPATSYFNNCELAAPSLPTAKEKAILSKYKDQLPPSIFTEPTDKVVKLSKRERLRQAKQLLRDAGWHPENGIFEKDGKPFEFELLIQEKPHEQVTLAYADSLKKLGITMKLRFVDSAQYIKRKQDYDFDAVVHLWGQTRSPGKEQLFYWGSEAAEQPGTRNYPYIKSPVIDDLVNRMLNTHNRQDYEEIVHALDRVLMAGDYVVPIAYWNKDYVAYKDKFGMPDMNNPSQRKLMYHIFEQRVLDLWWQNGR
jgi:microcin C transport system substrate-binding protein